MTDKELKVKKEELKALRAESQKLIVDAKIEKEREKVKKLAEEAAEAALSPEEKEKKRKERETRVEALLKQQEKKAREEKLGYLGQHVLLWFLWAVILIIPFLI